MNLLFLFSSHSRSISIILKSLKALVLIPSRFPLERPTRCLASTPHDREHHQEAPGGLATRFGGGTDDEVRRRPATDLTTTPNSRFFDFPINFQRWFRRVQTTVVSPPQLQGCLEQHQPGGHGNR